MTPGLLRRPSLGGDTERTHDRPDRATVISRLFAGVVTVTLVVVAARVAQLKASPGSDLSRYVSDRVGLEWEPSPRGDLLDRRGRAL